MKTQNIIYFVAGLFVTYILCYLTARTLIFRSQKPNFETSENAWRVGSVLYPKNKQGQIFCLVYPQEVYPQDASCIVVNNQNKPLMYIFIPLIYIENVFSSTPWVEPGREIIIEEESAYPSL